MLKVYYLTAEQLATVGYHKIDPMRFNNVQEVASAEEADLVVIPLPLRDIIDGNGTGVFLDNEGLARIIKAFNLDERRVTAYDCSDWYEDYELHPNCLFIRCNTKKWYLQKMPRTISWPWPVENWAEVVPLPPGGFKYDVSGHMWMSSHVRQSACDSVKATFGDRADIVTRKEFWGYLEYQKPEEAMAMKAAMKRSMQESRIALCPSSIHGVFPYRFFEALSSGRVPALFCTDHVFPWENKIDYSSCCALFREEDAPNAGRLIKEWLSKHSDEEIIEMGKRGRAYWEQWLDRSKFEDLKTVAVEEALGRDGLLRS